MPVLTKAQQQAERQDAIERLRAMLQPGDTLYTVLKRHSASGMTRGIAVVVPCLEDRRLHTELAIEDISWLVARALDRRRYDDGSIKEHGAGMDMGFHLVYSLGCVLWPDGFEHNGRTHPRNGSTSPRDDNGGYALNQRWL